MSDWLKIASKNIKYLKALKGWTQENLADKASISRSVVRDLEAGNERATSSLDTISKIAKAFDVSLSDLLADGIERKGIVKSEPISIFAKKLMIIPDDIYDLAQEVGDDKEIWSAVEGTILGLLNARERKAAKKNQA